MRPSAPAPRCRCSVACCSCTRPTARRATWSMRGRRVSRLRTTTPPRAGASWMRRSPLGACAPSGRGSVRRTRAPPSAWRSFRARLASLFERHGTRAVLTHPYEGGHPDHDSVAFCVRAAVRLLARGGGGDAPEVAEMAFYHRRAGGLGRGPVPAERPCADRRGAGGRRSAPASAPCWMPSPPRPRHWRGSRWARRRSAPPLTTTSPLRRMRGRCSTSASPGAWTGRAGAASRLEAAGELGFGA